MLGDKHIVPELTPTVLGNARGWFQKRQSSADVYPFAMGSLEDRVSFWCTACVAAAKHEDYAFNEFVRRETRLMAWYWRGRSEEHWRTALPITFPTQLEELPDRSGDENTYVTGEFVIVPFEASSWCWAGTANQESFPAKVLAPIRSHSSCPRDAREEIRLVRGQCHVPISKAIYILVEGYARFLRSNRAVFDRRRTDWCTKMPWLLDIKAPLSPIEELHQKYEKKFSGKGCSKPLELETVRKPPCIVSMERQLAVPRHLKFQERENYVAYVASLAHPSRVLPYIARQWRAGLQREHGEQRWESQWKLLETDVKALAKKVQERKRTYGCKAMSKTGHCLFLKPAAAIATQLSHDPQIATHRLTTIKPTLLNEKTAPQSRCGLLLQAFGVTNSTYVHAPWEFSIRDNG